jgi:ATP-dependent protease ClpP protease subunit
MAGETRVIPEGAIDALMIHLPWMEAAGNHSELTDYLKELKNTEDSLVKFYSDALGLDNTTIHSLLKSETYLNATQAKDLGFATMLQVPQKAIARLQNNEIKEENLMNKLNKN